jgi:hypothetical protein
MRVPLRICRPFAAGLPAVVLIGLGTVFAALVPAALVPAALASASGSAAGRPVVRAEVRAGGNPAPLVTDAQPRSGTKRGLPAPLMSGTMAWANVRRQASAVALLQLMARRLGPDVKCINLACDAGLPAARDLAATQQPQVRNYYCGPATVSEMLAQMGVKLSQVTAARELGTTVNGTDWSNAAGYPVPRVLNENQARNVYVAVALPWTPTSQELSTYEVDLVSDVNSDGGVPLAGNAYEVAGGPHLVGNPVDQTIMHWVDIRGYQDYGAITDYEDSVHNATSIGWGVNVPAYSSMASSTFVDILGARGYDW